ncbi:hypothetical protein [Radiobacillus sp. PE A8.2]|uniref:hypothetical protein n=1 Tax=Radiobacillus sp. PE A8.2 TaxID=3380349 RepID=UPI00388E867E
MNRLEFIGASLLLSGAVLFGFMHLAIANYVPNMGGWSDPPGKFNQVLRDTMITFPYYLGLILILTGLVLLFLKDIIKVMNFLIGK